MVALALQQENGVWGATEQRTDLSYVLPLRTPGVTTNDHELAFKF